MDKGLWSLSITMWRKYIMFWNQSRKMQNAGGGITSLDNHQLLQEFVLLILNLLLFVLIKYYVFKVVLL